METDIDAASSKANLGQRLSNLLVSWSKISAMGTGWAIGK